MTERINITPDRINFNEDTGILEITIKEDNDLYRPNIWRQQILDDQEKAKKLDNLDNLTSMAYPKEGIQGLLADILQDKKFLSSVNPKILEQENKELTEEIEKCNQVHGRIITKLEQKLEKIKK